MLKLLRNKKTAKKIWIALAILVLPAFVLWGSGSIIRSKQEPELTLKVFGRRISFPEYKDAMDAIKNQLIIQYGDNFSEIQKNLNLETQALERLILLMEAKKRKITVTDKEVIELLRSYPFFQRKGRFDNTTYSQILQYVFRTPERLFEEQTRQNLILFKLYEGVTKDVTLTDEEMKEAYQKSNEQINIYYIASLQTDFLKDAAVSEHEIQEYFRNNSFVFKEPLSFNIEYVYLPLESKKEEEAIKDKIKNITLRLNKKEDFAKVTGEFGLTVKETGLFKQTDAIPGIGWSPEILRLIAKAQPGQFLPPIYLDKNFYIIRVKERKEPYIPDFETIKDKVKETFIKDRAQKLAQEKIEGCLKKMKELYQANPKSVDFDKIAKEYGLKSDSTDLFKYGSYIESIGASDNFWIAAEKLKDDEFSEIISGTSGFYIIKLKSRIPIDEKKFAAEKNEFAQKLLLQKKQEYFGKFAWELKRQAQAF